MNTAILLVGLLLGGAQDGASDQQPNQLSTIRVTSGPVVTNTDRNAASYFDANSSASTVVVAPLTGNNTVTGSSVLAGSTMLGSSGCESPGCAGGCSDGCNSGCASGCGCGDGGCGDGCCGAGGCNCCKLMQYRLRAPNNMFPHTPYQSDPKLYYYFRPYHWSHVYEQQGQAGAWGASPANPYSNRFFDDIYESIELDD